MEIELKKEKNEILKVIYYFRENIKLINIDKYKNYFLNY